MLNYKFIKNIFFIFLISSSTFSQNVYNATDESLKARKWFEDARLDLFIHCGVYSVLVDGDRVMNQQKFSIKEYKKLPSFFNPIDFNPLPV